MTQEAHGDHIQASAGVVTVIVGVMESGGVAAVAEAVDAEASDS
jgi:hypothetical protein